MTNMQFAITQFLQVAVNEDGKQPTRKQIAQRFSTTERYVQTMLCDLEERGIVELSGDSMSVLAYHVDPDANDAASSDPMQGLLQATLQMNENIECLARTSRYNADTLEQILHELLDFREDSGPLNGFDPDPPNKPPHLRLI